MTAPVRPPRGWFTNPRLDRLTPLTVTSDGRVYGHLAPWDTCHRGIIDRCVTAPRGGSYRQFKLGAVECDDGTTVAAGTIMTSTDHPDDTLRAVAAQRQYSHTGRAVADVNAGEDRWGVWVAGAVRPDATPAQVRTLRASPLSGDWRDVGGRLELIAALAVNTPGFPVPRTVAASAGRRATLVGGCEHLQPRVLCGCGCGMAVAGDLESDRRTRPAAAPTTAAPVVEKPVEDMTADEIEAAADALVADFDPEWARQRDAERLKWARARVRSRRARQPLTAPHATREPAAVYHRPPSFCSAGGCEDCGARR